jgi:hypothetical protein
VDKKVSLFWLRTWRKRRMGWGRAPLGLVYAIRTSTKPPEVEGKKEKKSLGKKETEPSPIHNIPFQRGTIAFYEK